MNGLDKLSRELDAWFSGKSSKGNRPQYWFRVGSNTTPTDDAEWFGPFASKREAMEAQDRFERHNPMLDPADPYPWTIEKHY